MSDWVECQLCPKFCSIAPGMSGDCRIRVNLNGKLISTTYGYPVSVHADPIEKKPLFHFLPSSIALSVATVGCNLHCKHCQNFEISQTPPELMDAFELPPQQLVSLALQHPAPSIAYTYTEPLTYYEYTLDCSRSAAEKGVKNILVTAGYINPKPLAELLPFIHGANVDIKAFTEKFYQDVCQATLKPVLRMIEDTVKAGVWVEITYLIIPSLNDSPEEIQNMCSWVRTNLGPNVPVHFSRFFPKYRLRNLPPTPESTLVAARNIALRTGLNFVYLGNTRTPGSDNTQCPNPICTYHTTPLVQRTGYTVTQNLLVNGKCPACSTTIPGVWK